ncbi:transmembrane protein 200A [Epinephelus moara]|uniref:transmembrane protein 200A n=1 Tax=Epinephelus moara TaxID=300413 RepID=UPI00214F1978|nr:transmembrane protein 200A [Epinephelus moara]XP_049889955.1 transmembrane protein 200A [Epinephelus moara]XP_049889956.1 transmembrane protein 200A [Epinephelus moara]XP_049889957.1 transmembrane protein 200A [Epinephelus moara]XP_049889958.1 transmembrane protein 200A [Epinephelus moara]XP_049889959.1 transmembrane protein 200A [Epinephelus moara]XP_049889960.1 transmembrane protein 200A [Epinephelus moara]
MKTQKAQGVTSASPPSRRKSCFTLRGRKKKDRVIQGKLRIRSLPGAFLVLGVIVVVVGTALAVAGYWPYRISRSSILGAAEGESISESQSSGWSLGAKGLLSTAGLIHSERMKLLGPVIMGVGLFILICANTVLYENRDRETQMLLAQMRSVICSVSAAVPSADLKEIAAANSMAKHYQWVSSLPAAHLNILCLQQLASSEPLLQTRYPRDQMDGLEGIYQQAVLQTEALHHQESEPPPSNSSSCNSSETNLNTESGAEHRGSTSFNLQPASLVKLSNCLVSASSMSTLDEVDTPAVKQRRCHSMSYRTNPYIAQNGVSLEDGLHTAGKEAEINQLVVTSREAGSQVCVNIPWQVVDAAEEQTHRSWPQLDLGSGRRYLKLENKEDSVDKLLVQLEQHCSQWDKNFGSGPFQ